MRHIRLFESLQTHPNGYPIKRDDIYEFVSDVNIPKENNFGEDYLYNGNEDEDRGSDIKMVKISKNNYFKIDEKLYNLCQIIFHDKKNHLQRDLGNTNGEYEYIKYWIDGDFCVFVCLDDDEWYYLILSDELEPGDVFKCDGIDGLLTCIEDMVNFYSKFL